MQPAGAWRPGLLDSQHCLQPSGGFDPFDWRLLRRGVLQQYDPVGDVRHAAERALAEQSDTGTEREVFWWRYGRLAAVLDEHEYQLFVVRLQRLRSRAGFGRWDSPPSGISADYPAPGYSPVLERREFATLEAYSEATGQDRHSVMLDYSVFENVPRLDARDDSSLQSIYEADDLDFGLVRGSAAIDRGVVLPNVNDNFTGSAPDLGALEFGVAAPHFGPRYMNP